MVCQLTARTLVDEIDGKGRFAGKVRVAELCIGAGVILNYGVNTRVVVSANESNVVVALGSEFVGRVDAHCSVAIAKIPNIGCRTGHGFISEINVEVFLSVALHRVVKIGFVVGDAQCFAN